MAEVTKHVCLLGLGILKGTHTQFPGFPEKWVYKSVVLFSGNSIVQPTAITAII